MKKILLPLVMFLLYVLALSSCLGSNDDTYTYYDDTAITSFSVGTLNRWVHTTSSTGADSIYKTTVQGSLYKFYIDQLSREIYNPDSLPLGTDTKHVLVTIGTKNSGIITLKSMTSDSLWSVSSSDSIDFSQPRTFRVFSNSGSSQRDYTIHVNVHQQDGDDFQWTLTGTDPRVAAYTNMKAVGMDGKICLFGTKGTSTELSVYDADGKASVSNELLAEDTWNNVTSLNGTVYVKDGEQLLAWNGTAWESLQNNPPLARLFGVSSVRLYGLSENGQIMSSSDNGQTWTVDAIDSDSGLLPATDINCICTPLTTNTDAERLVLTGNRSIDAYPDEAHAVVWGKIDEQSKAAMHHSWMYYTPDGKNDYLLPRLSGLSVVSYNDGMLAFGGQGIGGCTESPYQLFYESMDGGITWHASSQYSVPSGFSATGSVALASDTNGYLWLFCSGSGQIWRGRLNKLGWAKEPKIFQE